MEVIHTATWFIVQSQSSKGTTHALHTEKVQLHEKKVLNPVITPLPCSMQKMLMCQDISSAILCTDVCI